ncbi:MAG: hypothetical protein QF741_04010 [Candidatus Peribacteraceae bacterium]|jgi:hypothetical protein|nr:hypothetical protein [Candidatus Peribacteraceae bacterium]MDP7453930.1 hypothetical protein [Candidatus Peribacteraceae bacterium]MDP7646203.1 hypothetical protein [Candidatus Peribacteraceae bacterium]|tara:strand:- start:379 stop:951 length:573 start_codon:yes stop_codon:yes gene_type:complete
MKQLFKSSLTRQVAGAIIGASVAYGLYLGYQVVQPPLGAFIHTFWDGDEGAGARFAEDQVDIEDRQLARQAQRNREIAKHFASDDPPGQKKPTPFERIAEKAQQYQGQITPKQEKDLIKPDATPEPEPEIRNPKSEKIPPPPEQWQKELDSMEKQTAESGNELPDSGFGLGIAIAGAAGATAVVRRRKKK